VNNHEIHAVHVKSANTVPIKVYNLYAKLHFYLGKGYSGIQLIANG